MTAQLLSGELTTLIQDTKRRAPEIRTAAEKSIADLKALANTSESQLAAGGPEFVRPFLLACKSGNPKYATTAVTSLQRLVAANGLAQERLEELLEALRECSSLVTDVQLRVLQIMPSLFQRYGELISESRLATALQVCFVLQAAKNAMISHTAAATLQQIVNDVFGRVGTEKALAEVSSPDSSKTSWQAELDCHQVLQDLCSIAEGRPVESLKKANVSKDFALELIGTILNNHTEVIPKYTNFVDILRQQLLPLMLRVVSSSASFAQTVRVLRLVPPVVEGFLEVLPTELEMLLSMLTHMLEPDAAAVWKRTMCMEAIRDVYKQPSNTRRMFALFDQQKGHKPVVQEQLAMLGRLSTEKPAVIGLGQSSSMPTITEQNDEDFDGLAALQADPLTATAGVSFTNKVATNSGISVTQSTVKVALLDQLDKADAPSVPESYIYALVLSSLNLLCEGLAKFVLPFANSKNSKRRDGQAEKGNESDETSDEDQEEEQLPTNPLELEGHPDQKQIKAAAGLLEGCWPALLNTYSTFFQAALDVEYYHTTIRSFQKLIQVATLLRSATARDAFLTALAKQSLPSSDESRVLNGSTVPRLSARNLLCLRALLNLGIALGAVLGEAWSIVLSTLQEADVVIGHISTDRTLSKGGPASIAPTLSISGDLSKEFSSEVAAVRSAASRMLGSVSELPPRQYLRFLSLLSSQLRGQVTESTESTESTASSRPDHHRRSSSNASNNRADGLQDLRANVFVIDVFSQLIDLSKPRLGVDNPAASGWQSMVSTLLRLVESYHLDPEVRFAAADTICKSVVAATFAEESDDRSVSIIAFGFATLRRLVTSVTSPAITTEESTKSGNPEIHNAALQTLKSCLDQYGDSVGQGWNDACDLVLSVFQDPSQTSNSTVASPVQAQPGSQRLLRSAFASLQIICSDLIESLPHQCLPKVLRVVESCCSQSMDLNVSLTSTSLYQNLSDSIWAGQSNLELVPKSSDTISPRAQLWTRLLDAISEGTASEQAEVRNSAVHACFRIFNTVGNKLLPEHWAACVEATILKLYRLNSSIRSAAVENNASSEKLLSLDDTAAAIHTSACGLFEDYLAELLKFEGSEKVWANFVRSVSTLVGRESLSLTTTIYSGFSRIFANLANDDSSFATCTSHTWKLFLGHEVWKHKRLDRPASSDNQAALTAFVACATEAYRISSPSRRAQVAPQLLRELADGVSESTPTSFAGDLLTTTQLQADSVKLLNYIYAATDASISHSFLLVLAKLVSLSHEKERPNDAVKGPTFVAITKDIARLIEQFVRERGASLNLQQEPAMLRCLESLNLLIRHKRSWRREEKTIQVWQQATTSALNALSPLLTLSLESQATKTSRGIWESSLETIYAILGAGDESDTVNPSFPADLAFDIDAFNRSYHLLVPNLSSQSRPGSAAACSEFARILLLRSIIHDPHPDDSLDPLHPTQWPNPERIGRVSDLEPNHRVKLCYLLIDRLFELVMYAGKSAEHGRLALAVAPYLRLRVELVLKAYISDQPLRGRMPCPLSQKKELRYLVGKSISMDQGTDVSDDTRRLSMEHRRSLNGLAIVALRVTRWDEETKDALLNLVEASANQPMV